METAVIVLFFASVLLFGLWRGFHSRSVRENVYYALSLAISLVVLLLRSHVI